MGGLECRVSRGEGLVWSGGRGKESGGCGRRQPGAGVCDGCQSYGMYPGLYKQID